MDNVKGSCIECGCEIAVSEVICKNCLDDLEKEAIYEEYLNHQLDSE